MNASSIMLTFATMWNHSCHEDSMPPGGLLASKLCQGLTGHLQSMDAWLEGAALDGDLPGDVWNETTGELVGKKHTFWKVAGWFSGWSWINMNSHHVSVEWLFLTCEVVGTSSWGVMWYVLCAWGGGVSILIPVFRQYIFKSHLAKGFTSPANHTGEIPAYLLLQMRKAEAGRPQAELEIFWTSNVFADGLLHRPSRSSQRDSHRALPVHLARKNWHRCAIGCP